MRRYIKKVMYDPELALEVARNDCPYRREKAEKECAIVLMRTAGGRFFLHSETCWPEERDTITTLTTHQARVWYSRLSEHALNWEGEFGEQTGEE